MDEHMMVPLKGGERLCGGARLGRKDGVSFRGWWHPLKAKAGGQEGHCSRFCMEAQRSVWV